MELRYSVVEIEEGRFAVQVGRPRMGTFNYLSNSVTCDREKVELEVSQMNVEDLLAQAKGILEEMPYDQEKIESIGASAYREICDTAHARLMNCGDVDENDPYGYRV